jgi:hypothetical protein
MSDKEVKTTTLGSIGTSLLVLILLVIVVVIVIYVIQSAIVPPYPVSPFHYEDTVVIRPAILTANPPNTVNDIDPHQYLRPSNIYRNQNGCLPPYDYGSASGFPLGYALTFDGEKDKLHSQWVLKQFSSPGNYDANQSLIYGEGNRFYLHNKSNPNPIDPKARARFQRLNQNTIGFCYNTSPIVMGADGGEQQCNWFNTEWLVYFLPTNYPDLYYMLFPSCWRNLSDDPFTDLTRQPNNAIASIRPWAPNNGSTKPETCTQCDLSGVTYDPFVPGQPGVLNQNVLIANALVPNNFLPPYKLPPIDKPNVLLFHITKV